MAVLELNLDDKPNLTKMLLNNKPLAMEVLTVFAQLMEEACDPSKGITWAELPKKLNPELSFTTLIKGILRGSLDVRQMSPTSFAALQEEVHPLAYLGGRHDVLSGKMQYWNWRDHFKLPHDAVIGIETVAEIIRKLWYYGRYVNVEQLSKAITSNQVATFRGIDQLPLLPMIPALTYQREQYGDLHVGKFLRDIGAFDCGHLNEVSSHDSKVWCPACAKDEPVQIGNCAVCPSCNAGFMLAKEH